MSIEFLRLALPLVGVALGAFVMGFVVGRVVERGDRT